MEEVGFIVDDSMIDEMYVKELWYSLIDEDPYLYQIGRVGQRLFDHIYNECSHSKNPFEVEFAFEIADQTYWYFMIDEEKEYRRTGIKKFSPYKY